MRLTLFKKILFSMLFISILMVVGMAGLINFSFQSGLQNYLNEGEKEKLELVALQVAPYYSQENGWNNLTIEQWQPILVSVLARSERNKKNKPKLGTNYKDRLLKRVGLLDSNQQPIFKNYKPRVENELINIPVKYQEQIVGWVSTKKRNAISGALENSFYRQQQQHLLWIVLWVALLSFSLAWLLVRHLLTPLKQLEQAASSLQQGDYTLQVPVKGDDELSALSARFNELTHSLLQQKETREQWLADISHELRTPISVLKSEIEAIQDGIRQPEPKYIDSLHQQVQNLSELVNDLYQLSLSDAGMQFNLSEGVDIKELLQQTSLQYQVRCKEKQIALETVLPEQENILLTADKKSLLQLFANLFENSLRYTDSPGSLKVLMDINEELQTLEISFQDSAPGVPEEALSKLFDRLYRVDASRSRLSGGAGLGLSICQTIVNTHSGKIDALHSSQGGLTIHIQLPLSNINN